MFIEGDNLEVLKLLQRSYSNKVKMIYIDPPYNTGKKFIYNDNFRDRKDKHSKWLSMMYPRLYLAKSLLRNDGVIFISIDDHEQHRLRMICDEIFGEENFVTQFVWNGKTGGADDKYIRNNHEYIICYARNKINFIPGEQIKHNEKFPKYDTIKQKYYKTQLARKWGANSRNIDRPNLFYPILAPDGAEVFPMLNETEKGCWRWSQVKMNREIKLENVEFIKNGKYWNVYEKIYKPEEGIFNTQKYFSWLDNIGNTAYGSKELQFLITQKIFDFPKPTNLIKRLINVSYNIDDKAEQIILDFFSGSSTTAHAVMQLNAEDDGNRKYIMVQLPEICDEKSEAFKAGYRTIADIGKERIRRAAEKIKLEKPEYKGDLGFKVFKLE
jgi:adenine-specific DNA-methyltransferase